MAWPFYSTDPRIVGPGPAKVPAEVTVCPGCHGTAYSAASGWSRGTRCTTCDGTGEVSDPQFSTHDEHGQPWTREELERGRAM